MEHPILLCSCDDCQITKLLQAIYCIENLLTQMLSSAKLISVTRARILRKQSKTINIEYIVKHVEIFKVAYLIARFSGC